MKSRNFLRWLQYVLRHRHLLVVAIFMLLFGLVIDVIMPRTVGYTIDHLLSSTALHTGHAHLPLFGSLPLRKAILSMFGALIFILLLRAIAFYIMRICLATVGERVHLDLRQDLFEHLTKLPITYFDTNYTGMIMARITTDADALWHLVNDGVIQVIAPLITIVTVIVLLFFTNVKLTLFSLTCLPILAILYARTRVKATVLGRAQRDAVATVFSRLQEKVGGIRLIRILGQLELESRSFAMDLRHLYDTNMRALRAFIRLNARSQFLTGATTMSILCLGGLAVINQTLTVGELVSFYLYAGMLFNPVLQLTQTANVFTNAEVAIERIFALLDTPVSEEFTGAKISPCFRGQVSVKHLSFAYNEGHDVLHEITFNVKPGEKVALVGPSGAGKSTLVNLICRFYNAASGSICIDGVAISDLEIQSYRRQIGYMSQDSFLFSGTVADNIRFSKPEATLEEIESAAIKANAHDFIMQLPKGYDTEIGERGVMLSGGQKQRINIARLLMRDAAILILDEPTSALDAESEALILDALETVFKDKTCFIIAHRLSTIISADRILVFEQGRLVQQGTHRELAEQPGLYHGLWKRQFIGFGGSPIITE